MGDDMGSADFKTFIDGPTSPANGLINKVFPINPAGNLPESAFPTMPAAPVASSGDFFFIKHTFTSKDAAAEFWASMPEVDMEAFTAANKAKGFHNHYFMPTTDPSTVFCIWESKAPVIVDEFQAFADELFPGTFVNEIYPVMAGGAV